MSILMNMEGFFFSNAVLSYLVRMLLFLMVPKGILFWKDSWLRQKGLTLNKRPVLGGVLAGE